MKSRHPIRSAAPPLFRAGALAAAAAAVFAGVGTTSANATFAPANPAISERAQPGAELAELRSVWARGLSTALKSHWQRPASDLPVDLRCRAEIHLKPDGTVLSVRVDESSGSAEFDGAVLAAIQRASPLPVPSDPTVFSAIIRPVFTPAAFGESAPSVPSLNTASTPPTRPPAIITAFNPDKPKPLQARQPAAAADTAASVAAIQQEASKIAREGSTLSPAPGISPSAPASIAPAAGLMARFAVSAAPVTQEAPVSTAASNGPALSAKTAAVYGAKPIAPPKLAVPEETSFAPLASAEPATPPPTTAAPVIPQARPVEVAVFVTPAELAEPAATPVPQPVAPALATPAPPVASSNSAALMRRFSPVPTAAAPESAEAAPVRAPSTPTTSLPKQLSEPGSAPQAVPSTGLAISLPAAPPLGVLVESSAYPPLQPPSHPKKAKGFVAEDAPMPSQIASSSAPAKPIGTIVVPAPAVPGPPPSPQPAASGYAPVYAPVSPQQPAVQAPSKPVGTIVEATGTAAPPPMAQQPAGQYVASYAAPQSTALTRPSSVAASSLKSTSVQTNARFLDAPGPGPVIGLPQKPPKQLSAALPLSTWHDAVLNHLRSNWNRPVSIPGSLRLQVAVQLSEDGEVLDSKILQPSFDSRFDQSILLAIRKASPFPVPTDVVDFDRVITPTLTPDSLQ